MDQGQSITLKIGGTPYPLKVKEPEMEQLMRVAAETINQKLAAYDARFPERSLSDKLSFVALNETVARLVCQKKLATTKEEAGKLQEELESYLKNIEK